MAKPTDNVYKSLIAKIFSDRYRAGSTELAFARTDLEKTAAFLNLQLPKNLGDVVYSLRYRTEMPEAVLRTQPKGMQWIIEGAGRAKYAFKLVRINRIVPNPELITIKIPDATPEIISAYALSDEQALLAKVRYNRLIDIFLGLASYSLQNHLRTTVRNVGQIEIDEIYVGVDRLKEVAQAERPKLEKKVASEKIGSRLDMRMEYARDLEDREDEWSWRVKRDWGDAFWTRTLEPYLNHYATKLWKDIEAELASRSKRHKSYPTAAICSEAYARLRTLNLDDQERIFRFRMTGPHRLYGFRFGHVFKTVWFDPTHQIYPSKK